MTQPVNDIIFILDESGSIDSMDNKPEQSVNAFIKEQRDLMQDKPRLRFGN